MFILRNHRFPAVAAMKSALIAMAAILSGEIAVAQKTDSPSTAAAGSVTEPTNVGRYALVAYIVGKGTNDSFFLIDVSKWDKDGVVATVKESVTGRPGWTIQSTASPDGRVQLELTSGDMKFSFDGVQTATGVRGEFVTPSGFVAPARIQPATVETLAAYVPPPEEYLSERAAALKAEGAARATALQAFADKHPESPLALDACYEILRSAKQDKTDASIVEKAAATFISLSESWGARLARHAAMTTAEVLSDVPQFNPLALHYIAKAEAGATEQDPVTWKEGIEFIKGHALIQSEVDAQRKEGAAILWKHHEEDIFNTRLTAALLAYEQTHGDLDKAIELAAQFAAFPPTSTMDEQWNDAKKSGVDVRQKLKEQFAALWTKKHGNSEGMEAYLDKAYLRALDELKADRSEPPSTRKGDRVTLVEFFTGSSCPTCLAADMALSNLERSLPSGDIVVLRYQQNIPVADPLTVMPGANRADYYRIKETPTAYINGAIVQNIGGFREGVPHIEMILQDKLESFIGSPGEITLGVSAENRDGLVLISAEAGNLSGLSFQRRFAKFGIAIVSLASLAVLSALVLLSLGTRASRFITARFDAPWIHALLKKRVRIILAIGLLGAALLLGYQLLPRTADVSDLRLRLALTEDGISFPAPNGVRVHERVVRAMPGTEKGVHPVRGQLKFDGKIDLAKLRQQLINQMSYIETNMYVKFAVKPPVDLAKLRVVAFVQSDATREVLQAASVSFDGLTAVPGTPEEAKTAAATSPTDAKPAD
jgi:hypothetical protein